MKKLVVKIAFILTFALLLAFSMSAITAAYADEIIDTGEQAETEITGEITPKDDGTGEGTPGTPKDTEGETKKETDVNDIIDGSNLSEEDKNLIKDLVSKVEEYTKDSESVFVRVYVPMICAGALTLIFGIILLLPFLKKTFQASTVKKMLENAKKQIEELKGNLEELKKDTDVQSIKTDIEKFLEEEIARLAALINDSLSKNDLTINEIDAKTSALVAGAQNAWRGSPEAVDKLSAAPSKTEYEKMKAENNKLWAYVYAKNGENAKKEIENL